MLRNEIKPNFDLAVSGQNNFPTMARNLLSLFLFAPLFCLAQPVLKPHIGLSSTPNPTDSICSIPVYQGNFQTTGYFAGDNVPDFTLYKTNGDSVRLRDLLLGGKPVLLVNGNYTCPVFRNKIGALNEMTNYYGPLLQVFVVYTVEAHPIIDPSPYNGQVWVTNNNIQEGVLFPQPKTYGERVALIDTMLTQYDIVPDILVDGPCNAWWSNFGPAPNNAYLIDPNGTVAAKHGWFHRTPDNMWCDIDELLGTESGKCTNVGNNGTFSLTLNDTSYVAQGWTGEVLAVHTTLKNLSNNNNVEIRITKQNSNIPSGWGTALCADICYAPDVDFVELTLAPGESQPFIFYFYTDDVPGTGMVNIRFTNLNLLGNQILQLFTGITQMLSSVGYLEGNDLRVFPNPSADWVQIRYSPKSSSASARLCDPLGRVLVQTPILSEQTNLSVAHLPPGLYLLTIRDLGEEHTLKLLRQ